MFKIPWIFRFLIGLERRIKIADTSPNTILLLEPVELNTRIIMRKMRVLSNLLTPLGPCDPCMGVADSSVGGVATLEADSSKTQDGVLRRMWKPKICKFWVKPKRTRKGMLSKKNVGLKLLFARLDLSFVTLNCPCGNNTNARLKLNFLEIVSAQAWGIIGKFQISAMVFFRFCSNKDIKSWQKKKKNIPRDFKICFPQCLPWQCVDVVNIFWKGHKFEKNNSYLRLTLLSKCASKCQNQVEGFFRILWPSQKTSKLMRFTKRFGQNLKKVSFKIWKLESLLLRFCDL